MSNFVNENLLEPDQRTAEWFASRSGKFTGSRFKDVLARRKPTKEKPNGEPLKAYHDLIDQIVTERLTGEFVDTGMDSYALKWGREVEPFARQAYQFETGEVVTTCGFVTHKTLPFVGASPDGLVGTSGGTEFKCPKSEVIHMKRFDTGMDEEEFMPQVQGCIWIFDRDWWDWVSFCPKFQGGRAYLRFYRQRIYRDDAFIANMERAILLAEGEVRKRLENYTPERIEQIMNERNKL